MKWFLRIFLSLLAAALIGVLSIAVINRYVYSNNSGKIKTSITEIPTDEPKRVAIVFGARVFADGRPTNSLYDRVLTGVELYRAGRVKKLLMTGDRQGEDYDEPAAMKKMALELGVAESDIVLDNDGKRTYDSCYRAREIFEVQRAILVTQDYHQPRALYLCSSLGIDSIGITANRRTYDREDYYHLREFFSVASAWFEINFLPFEVAKGQKQPIQQ
ncbi:MAG TPA: ElyC/SanA/YdcF family protein [Pyrinomonadaceae bacterium]|jgi:vancomycin permeability regulator SanA|nr:ElyC/SanA/YdcF family protein [Pyrinomonadaceae bacterium]